MILRLPLTRNQVWFRAMVSLTNVDICFCLSFETQALDKGHGLSYMNIEAYSI